MLFQTAVYFVYTPPLSFLHAPYEAIQIYKIVGSLLLTVSVCRGSKTHHFRDNIFGTISNFKYKGPHLKKLFSLLIFSLLPVLALANPLDQRIKRTADCLYSNSAEDSFFFGSYLKLMLEHRQGRDPFSGRRGITVNSFSLDQRPIIFLINEKALTIDLLFINWNRPFFLGLQPFSSCEHGLGLNLAILRDVKKSQLGTQGENSDILTNFSFIYGNDLFKSHGFDVHTENFLSPHHPLRESLGSEVIPMIHPSAEKLRDMFPNARDFRKAFPTFNDFFDNIFGMVIHEIHHIFEINDKLTRSLNNDKAQTQKVIIAIGKPEFKNSVLTYVALVRQASAQTKIEPELLKAIEISLAEIKRQQPYAYEMIRSYEYTEGIAEYVAMFSMLQIGFRTHKSNHHYQWEKDTSNSFFYKTGAFGGAALDSLGFRDWSKINTETDAIWTFIGKNYARNANFASAQLIYRQALNLKKNRIFAKDVIDTFTEYFENQPWFH
jgi:hypothetical protein